MKLDKLCFKLPELFNIYSKIFSTKLQFNAESKCAAKGLSQFGVWTDSVLSILQQSMAFPGGYFSWWGFSYDGLQKWEDEPVSPVLLGLSAAGKLTGRECEEESQALTENGGKRFSPGKQPVLQNSELVPNFDILFAFQEITERSLVGTFVNTCVCITSVVERWCIMHVHALISPTNETGQLGSIYYLLFEYLALYPLSLNNFFQYK